MKYIPFILLTVLTNAAAQLLLKYGMINLDPNNLHSGSIIQKILQVILNPWIFSGLSIYVISMASHLFVLSKVDLSFVYPFLSLTCVFVALSAWLLFNEDLGILKISGIALICIGTVLIAQNGDKPVGAVQSQKPYDHAGT